MRQVFLPLATVVLLVSGVLRLWQLSDYPPGPHYDEAVNFIITRTIAFGGARPLPIVEAYQGREVLYMYLNAPLLHLFGDDIFTLQLSGAFSGIITTAATMALGRALLGGRRGLLVGLAAGVALSLSFPQVFIARQAFRAVTLPLCQSLALLFLWRGLRRSDHLHGWLWLGAGGVFAGLTLYTYMASRLFPIWLLIAGAALLLLDHQRRGLRLRQGVVFFGVFAVIALPIIAFAIEKPDIFMGRLAEVTQDGESISLAESIYIHLRMFFIKGEPYLRYNIPGRPYLTWIEGGLLLVGIIAGLWQLVRTATKPLIRSGYLLLLLSPLMVIPSVISVGGLPPNHMRSIAMVPLIFLLVGVGFAVLFERLTASFTDRMRQALLVLLMILAVVGGGGLFMQTYLSWASRADLYYETHADVAAAVDWLPTQTDTQTIVYMASRDLGAHPTASIEASEDVTWLGVENLFRAPTGWEGLYIIPHGLTLPDAWSDWLAMGRLDAVPLGPDGKPAFAAYRLPGTVALPDGLVPPSERVQNAYLTLLGAQMPTIAPGSRRDVLMSWRIDRTPPFSDFSPIVQLEDRQGNVIVRDTPRIVETDRWRAGEVLLRRVRLRVPVGTPPGHYPLRVTWVGANGETYQPYTEADRSVGSVWATVGELEVIRTRDTFSPDRLDIAVRQQLDLAPGVRLLGWQPPPTGVRPGESLPVTLYWQAHPLNADREPLILDAVLVGGGSEAVIWSGTPLNGQFDLALWQDGELFTDRQVWSVPPDLTSGRYTLELRTADRVIDLGTVDVTGIARLYEPPPVTEQVSVDFGGVIGLRGYDLHVENNALTLRLVWSALSEIERDYTVFVHVVDENGQIVAQRDVMPVDNNYATSLWLPGEFVEDVHSLDGLPPGTYNLRIGLYSQADGARLTTEFEISSTDEYFNVYGIAIGR